MSATPCFSLEYGIATVSWYAWLALRRRVSMSAIGSVIVMMRVLSLLRFPHAQRRERTFSDRWKSGTWSPGGLGHAGQLATVSHLPEADTAQAELPVDGLRAAAALAAGVAANSELRLARS